jgi:hypothetical protein
MINEVRNTVLSILNKNNYGYISPSDFNLFASQAQMELYEEMFSSYNKIIIMENRRESGVGYADLKRTYEEAMEIFNVTNPLQNFAGSVFFLPSLSTTNDASYLMLKVVCFPTVLKSGANTSVAAYQLVSTTGNFLSANIVPGDVVVNTTTNTLAHVVLVSSNTVLTLDNNIFTTTPANFLVLKSSAAVEAEKVTHTNSTLLNTSMLTAPSTLFPSYTQQAEVMTVYPVSYKVPGQVIANYFRYPFDPKWTYINLAGGEPVFDQTQPDYQDFELPQDYQYKLATKILEYAGMSIRETEVVQFGMTQQAHEQPSFSVQQ